MADGHVHGSAATAERAGGDYRRRLLAALVLTLGYLVVEVVAGLLTNSLALVSDAGHMFTDVLGLGMALAAIQVATRPHDDTTHTFGLYRLEILAALANTVLLFGVAGYIVFEAVQRIGDPPEVLALPLLVVAVIGLVVNLVAFRLLREGAGDNINVEGASLDMLADTLGSVAVIAAAIVIQLTGFTLVDPILGVVIGLFVLPRAWRLGSRALRILVQASPEHVDLDQVRADLCRLERVGSVHDLHVWTLTSGMDVASVHLRLAAGTDDQPVDGHRVLDQARTLLRDQHGVGHATVQVEPADHAACDDCEQLTW